MGREVWGTYSVADHLHPRPWFADVMLYDRLAIPTPRDRDNQVNTDEYERWKSNGWDPDRQRTLLDILGEKAFELPWMGGLQEEWKARREIADQLDGKVQTGLVVLDNLPAGVTGYNAVPTYRTEGELREALTLSESAASKTLGAGQAVAIIGRRFLAPDPNEVASDDDLLRAAVDLASDIDFRRKRTAYWRWQREFFSDLATGEEISESELRNALEEMEQLLSEEEQAAKRSTVRLVALFSFAITAAAINIVAAPVIPLAVATASISLGQFVAAEYFNRLNRAAPGPAALLHSSRKEFGWN